MKFVDVDEMKTLEDYVVSLITAEGSLKTLQLYHKFAEGLGLLEEDEDAVGKTICVHINQLIALYRTQLENTIERTKLTEAEVKRQLMSLIPGFEMPETIDVQAKRKRMKKIQPFPDSNQ